MLRLRFQHKDHRVCQVKALWLYLLGYLLAVHPVSQAQNLLLFQPLFLLLGLLGFPLLSRVASQPGSRLLFLVAFLLVFPLLTLA